MASPGKDSWKAVVIVAADAACAGAMQLRGKRFLSRNAPRLPLPECTEQGQCQRKYRHVSDRRGPQRRGTEEVRIGAPRQPVAEEQRRPGERRSRRR